MAYDALLERAHRHARAFLDVLPTRLVRAACADPDISERRRLGDAEDAVRVLDHLAQILEDGSVATPGPRYFGFVTGGSYPVAVAADWMASAADQNGGLHAMSPAIAAIEDTAAAWLLDLFALRRTRASASSPARRWRT
jgi:glutamate/tyrosine decarboxylase-like PLP-dependent enzyme